MGILLALASPIIALFAPFGMVTGIIAAVFEPILDISGMWFDYFI